MTPILMNGPTVEPLSLAEAKEWLRLDTTDEDDLVSALIVSARLIVEASTRRVLLTQTWRLALDRWPRDPFDDEWFGAGRKTIEVPFAPFQRVAQISVVNASGAAVVVSPSAYGVDAAPDRARIYFLSAPPKPAPPLAGIAIDVVAGYGDQPVSVPEPLRLAVRLLVSRWFENRGDVEADAAADRLPGPVGALVAPYRRARLA